jgi:propanol-preferring alcohol dehydrogenase
MKAMVLHDTARIDDAPLKLEEIDAPRPAAGELRARVHTCAICRTDLHVIEGELPARKRPVIPGHQIVGTIDAIGDHVSQWKTGERIGIAWLRHTCGQCDFCAHDRENLCESSQYTGYHADGGYAEYAVVPADFAYRIPDQFDDVAAAPLLCAGIIGYRALRRANVPDNGTLALYGFGSSAHIVIQIARHRGYRVFVVSRGESHQELARDMGAEWAGDDPADMPEPCDSAILFAPVGKFVPPALEALKKGGTLALAGIYMTPIPELDYEKHVFYERDIRSVTSNTRDDARSLLAEAAEADVRPHVDSTYPLADANKALQDLKHGRIDGSAVLVVRESTR